MGKRKHMRHLCVEPVSVMDNIGLCIVLILFVGLLFFIWFPNQLCLFDLKKTLFKVIRGRMELSGKAHLAHAKPIPVLRLRSDIGLSRRLVQGLHKIRAEMLISHFPVS